MYIYVFTVEHAYRSSIESAPFCKVPRFQGFSLRDSLREKRAMVRGLQCTAISQTRGACGYLAVTNNVLFTVFCEGKNACLCKKHAGIVRLIMGVQVFDFLVAT